MPSHDITRESMPFLRDPLSVTTTLRGLSDASSTSSSWSSASGRVFCQLLSWRASRPLVWCLLLYAEPHTHPLLNCLHVYCLHPLSSGRFPTYHVPSVRRKLESAWVCQTLWYFGLTFFSQSMPPFMGVVDGSTTGPFLH
jgi:hypothetical protein